MHFIQPRNFFFFFKQTSEFRAFVIHPFLIRDTAKGSLAILLRVYASFFTTPPLSSPSAEFFFFMRPLASLGRNYPRIPLLQLCSFSPLNFSPPQRGQFSSPPPHDPNFFLFPSPFSGLVPPITRLSKNIHRPRYKSYLSYSFPPPLLSIPFFFFSSSFMVRVTPRSTVLVTFPIIWSPPIQTHI